MADPVTAVIVPDPDTVTLIKPGVQTSEYAAMQNSVWWAKLMIILGVLLTTTSGVAAGINEYLRTAAPPGAPAPGASQLVFVLMLAGIVSSVVGGIQKALSETTYISGRSLVKAAAVRDAAPPPVV